VIHLAIIDGSRMFADALAARLGVEPDIGVLRCATGSAALRQALMHSSADVVVGDAALFDPETSDQGSGPPGVAKSTTNGGPRRETGGGAPAKPAVVLLADRCDRARLMAAIRSGVRGWIPRDATLDDLILAIREAASGGTWIQPKVLTSVLAELTCPTATADATQLLLAKLTEREREVLYYLADGLGRTEVAARLRVSTNTVRTHVQSILSKLRVNSCVAAVAMARKAGARSPALRLLY
jgi:DNA-binding NarL/FixJ family response regulator